MTRAQNSWTLTRAISPNAYVEGQIIEETDRLAATAAPVIATHPVDRTAVEGTWVTFSVSLDHPDVTASFLWRLDGIAIPGATSANYTIGSVGLADAGRYTCDVWNSAGAETSDPAMLIVIPAAQAGRFVRFSVVTSLDTTRTEISLECVVGGAGTSGLKPVLVRAAGPSLVRFGVPNFNPDPRIELFSGATKTGGNDNWGGQAAVVEAAARVGAFPFVANDSADAALLIDATANHNSTIRISGQGGATGDVLAEVYDATPVAAVTATTPRLLSFSVLKMIPSGSNVSTGFVIAGHTAKTVLIRVIGPTLASLGMPDAMSDPVLTLLQELNPIATNAGWGGTPDLKRVFASAGAFSLEASSKDAAVTMTLAPGSYTVEANGANNTGGVALVEIYEVP